MAKRQYTTPKADGFRMPGEFEPQKQVFMIWPQRPDNWRSGAKPAQQVFVNVATAILQFEPVTMLVSPEQYVNCRSRLPDGIRVVEMTTNDAWVRDTGATFVVNDKGDVRGIDWGFNAWGGLYDGLYFPWDQDGLVAQKMCELEGIDSYPTPDFVLEGGSIHVDGEGTVITTEMCLLSPGRNPHMSKGDIEQKLKNYLNAEKVIWLKDGIDPDETNGHIDDMVCYIRPGEVGCIFVADESSIFYEASQAAYAQLCDATDAKGRKLTIRKLCMPKEYITIQEDFAIDAVAGSTPRQPGEISIASYMNFLIVNGGVIVPQYGDVNDQLALDAIQSWFPERKVVGIRTEEVAYAGGNIHCITQHQCK